MTTPSPGPCGWVENVIFPCPVVGEAVYPCTSLNTLDPTMAEAILQVAAEDLWNWTGRRYGLCEVTVRPCAEDCLQASTWQGWSGAPAGYYGGPYGGWFPYLTRGGSWRNGSFCDGCGSKQRCGCENISTIVLPGPVNEIVSVYISGVLVDPTVYRLDNLGLSRIDGTEWPSCQDMSVGPLADGAFTVTYLQGEPLPVGGQLALGALACEMAKQACNDKSCRLPKNATTVTREGVTISLPNTTELLKSGQSGIWEVDRWLASVQYSNRAAYSVVSPDVKRFRRNWPTS